MTNAIREKYTAEILEFYGELYDREYLDGLTDRNFNLIYEKYEDAKAERLWATL